MFELWLISRLVLLKFGGKFNFTGAFLPDLCKARKVNARREMFQLRSSGHTTAAGPTSAAAAIGSPTSSPGGMLAGGDYAPAPDSSHELYNPYYSWAPTPL